MDLAAGVLAIDDTVLDKPYARHLDLVGRHWPGEYHRVVQGIDLVSVRLDGRGRAVPCDYRVYHDKTQATKNDHFRAIVDAAHGRGLRPGCVLLGGWYSGLESPKRLRAPGLAWLTRLKCNRLVNKDRQGGRPLSRTEVAAAGTAVWLTGYGLVKVFRVVAPDGDTAYRAASDLSMSDLTRRQMAGYSWGIETYHRGIKQFAEAERCQARSAEAQRDHIGLVPRAFLRLEYHLFTTGVSWASAKAAIVRDAVPAYLAHPSIRLPTA